MGSPTRLYIRVNLFLCFREGDTPSLPDPRGAGGAIPRNGGATQRSRAMPTTSLPSSPLYPEEELVVYSSGGSQPSRILMRPIDSQVHRYVILIVRKEMYIHTKSKR